MESAREGESTASAEEGESTAPAEDEETGPSAGSQDSDSSSTSESRVETAVADVSSLPGETLNDQDGRKIGTVKEIYAIGDDETPMWVTVESSTGIGRTRLVFIPLARIKQQNDEIRVPYSFAHIHESPDIESGDQLSEEDGRALRSYYGIGLGDQELVQSAMSYASQVPEEEGEARKIDADAAEGPVRELDDTPPAERVAEAYEKQKEEEGEEHRKGKDTTADEIFEEDDPGEGKDSSDEKSGSGDAKDSAKEKSDSGDGKDSSEEKSDSPEGKDEGG